MSVGLRPRLRSRSRSRSRMKPFVLLLFLFTMLFANNDLVALYDQRMIAEEHQDTDKLLMIDTKLAEYYLSVSNYATARIFLENSISYATEPLLTDRKLDLYRLDIIEGDLYRAESGLINVYYFTKDQYLRSRTAMLLGILNALKGDYENSREFLIKSLKLKDMWSAEFETNIDSLLQDAKKRKNIETAKWLSGFLPGAGQIYAKNAKGAIGAIGIAAFWGGWFAYDLAQKDYYSAILVLVWPWQRYHRGNIQNAGYSVETYNARIEDNINRALLEYLSTK